MFYRILPGSALGVLFLVFNQEQAFAFNGAGIAPQVSKSRLGITFLSAATKGESDGDAKQKRPETSLHMSDTLESTTEDLLTASNSFQNMMQELQKTSTDQSKSLPFDPMSLSEEDVHFLKKLLEGHAKSKFELDSYWEEVRKPVDEATTIPPEVFRSQEFYDLERKKILEKTWMCVGTSDQVRNNGDVMVTHAAGKPLIITRAKDGEVRAFYNVCRHRGARLLSEEESGKKACISCPYHNWGYSLEGKLLGTPNWNSNPDGHKNSKPGTMMANSGTVKNFDREENGLLPVRVDIWGPFIYVNLSGDAPPLKEYLGSVPTDLEAFPFDELITVKEDKFEVNANWKLLAENYIDFYHLSVRFEHLVASTCELHNCVDLTLIGASCCCRLSIQIMLRILSPKTTFGHRVTA